MTDKSLLDTPDERYLKEVLATLWADIHRERTAFATLSGERLEQLHPDHFDRWYRKEARELERRLAPIRREVDAITRHIVFLDLLKPPRPIVVTDGPLYAGVGGA